MHTAPTDVTDDQILALVREHWEPSATAAQHLAVGFGAWHWRIDTADGPTLFASLDLPYWHTPHSAEATYAGAATLSASLEFVHPPLATTAGRYTVPLGRRWLGVTRWLDGDRPAEFDDRATEFLRRLHAAEVPGGVLPWETPVAENLTDELRDWTTESWAAGPFGEPAREMLRDKIWQIEQQLTTHRELTGRLDPVRFVPTHGEPDRHNQWHSANGELLLIDWETLRAAPRERDLWALPARIRDALQPDPAMAELFRLDWILSEVRSYADWLRGPHADDEDTRTALAGLRKELGRPTLAHLLR